MSRFALLLVAAALVGTPALADPVSVTRFIAADAAPTHGTYAVTTTPGIDPTSLEQRPWLDAVAHSLASLGFTQSADTNPDFVVEVHVERQTRHIDRAHPPVSVGMAGESGTYHSGFGMGVGFTLGGGPKDLVTTHLVVTIRERASGRPLWEGRADNTENAHGKRGGIDIAAPRLAQAVFTGFPGKSGETITVK
jgi:hypothetical protein